MKHLTIRNIPPEVAEALAERKNSSRKSLNQTVIDLLGRALGVRWEDRERNGLAALGGSWSEEEYREFEAALSSIDRIDEEMWR